MRLSVRIEFGELETEQQDIWGFLAKVFLFELLRMGVNALFRLVLVMPKVQRLTEFHSGWRLFFTRQEKMTGSATKTGPGSRQK